MNYFQPITSPVGNTTLIEASAGTGKTFNMALLILRFLLEGKKIDEILAVTFTRAATSELKERVRDFVSQAVHVLEKNRQSDTLADIEKMVSATVKKEGLKQTHLYLKEAYRNIDTAAVFTIHAFCHRIIQEYAFETGTSYNLELIGNDNDISLEIAQNYWLKTLLTTSTPNNFITHITTNLSPSVLIGYLKQWQSNDTVSDPPLSTHFSWEQSRTGESLNLIEDTRLFIYNFFTHHSIHIEKKSTEKGIVTYNSLITIMYDAVQNSDKKESLIRAVRARFKVALIDEFQDTDSKQYAIFSAFFGDTARPLICIGDPKQAIYSFRNADLHTYLHATEKNHLEYRYSLGTNWRSSDKMVTAINTFFNTATTKVEHPFIIPEISFNAVQPSGTISPLTINKQEVEPLVISFLDSDSVAKHHHTRSRDIKVSGKEYLAHHVATEILNLLNPLNIVEKAPGEQVTPSDIAILVSTHKEAELFKIALQKKDIPASILHQKSIFHTQIAFELLTILTAVANRSYSVMKAAIITDIFSGSVQEEDSFLEKFYEWWIEWEERGFLAAFSKISNDTNIRIRLAQRSDGERALTDLRHLSETLHAEEWSAKLNPHELLQWFQQMIASEKQSDAAQLRMDSDELTVTIVTLYAAKGLQWPIVFLPTLFNTSGMFRGQKSGIYHDGDGTNLYHYLAPMEAWPHPVKSEIEKEKLAEHIRLLYVGMTRSEKRCYLISGRFYSLATSSIGYLMHNMHTFYDLKKLSDNDLQDDIAQFEKKGLIVSHPIHLQQTKSRFEMVKPPVDKSAHIFQRTLDTAWSITSYSALTSHSHETHDVDSFLYNSANVEEIEEPENPETIFLFPAGPRAGTALHEIFENIDFTDDSTLNTTTNRVLSSYSMLMNSENESYEQTIVEMVKNVLNTQLPHGPQLSEISLENSIRELEFFFPFEQINGTELMQAINDDMTHVSFEDVKGFLHGFIDLIFRHKGKYYIVDWKSNLLGKTVKHYSKTHLKKAISDHNYRLQYLFYTVALHRWLSVTLDEYDFEKQFGGVYYIFLRGVRIGEESGIWSERPTKELINRLDSMLGGNR